MRNIVSSFTENNAEKPVLCVDKRSCIQIWWYAGAFLGLGGSFFAVIVGVLLNTISWFTGHNSASLLTNQIGTWLIITTIPLMMFGAHCLDKIDAAAKAARHLARLEKE